ncbi:MAG TPA: alpha-E domain-containing protein [Edaphocola sp.]|nr:alpha-E domain-containing protein [Edaphocola sp.]
MLSRVAENLFWMGRYMERSNSQLRAIRTYYVSVQDGIPFMNPTEINDVFNQHNDETEKELVDRLFDVIFNTDIDNSIISNIFKARENARSVQDHITIELWHTLNEFYLMIRDRQLQNNMKSGDPISVFDGLIQQCMLYFGVLDSYMYRGEGYYFLNFGKFIERATFTLRFSQIQYEYSNGFKAIGEELLTWRYFLFAMSGYEFYLKSHAGNIEPKEIFNQMMDDVLFPHSIAYSFLQIDFFGEKLSEHYPNKDSEDLKFVIGKANAALKFREQWKSDDNLFEFTKKLNHYILEIVSNLNKNYFGLV